MPLGVVPKAHQSCVVIPKAYQLYDCNSNNKKLCQYSFLQCSQGVNWNSDNAIHVLLQTCTVTFITTLVTHVRTTIRMHGCKFAILLTNMQSLAWN